MRIDSPGGHPACAWIPPRTRHSLPVLRIQTKCRSASYTLIGAEGKETGGLCLLSISYVPSVIINDSEKLGPLPRVT